MILLDDNFATIVIGVEEGRRIFENMKKTVSYIMAGNVTTLYPFLVCALFGFPLAIGTITVLLIALGTDMIPAIALVIDIPQYNLDQILTCLFNFKGLRRGGIRYYEFAPT